LRVNFRGVADISIEELSNLASIFREQAKRIAQRNYGEITYKYKVRTLQDS
jgi:hypothetical protein